MVESAVVVIGRIGTGKTAAAERLSTRLDGFHMDTDTTRLNQVVPLVGREEPRYDVPENRATYAVLTAKAVPALERGLTPVLEGSFSNNEDRTRLLESLAGWIEDVDTCFLHMVCDPEEARRRIRGRDRRDCASEATVDTYNEMSFDPVTDEWLADHGIHHTPGIPDQINRDTYIQVDNTGSLKRLDERIRDISEALHY
jgi:Predicted kinase|nr:MAG: putative kinase [Candidatus Nanosalinarum sp. J07AB56]